VIAARGLAKRYGERRVFAGIDADVPDGGFLLVTGPNGSGKTTLLRVLAGLAAPTAGELTLPSVRPSAISVTSRSSTAS
jgi:ABC-type multidrug transport system ATPase subunit